MYINMHELSLAHQSFGGKCGLMSANRAKRDQPSSHWLENSLQEPSLTAFPNPYYNHFESFTDLLLGIQAIL